MRSGAASLAVVAAMCSSLLGSQAGGARGAPAACSILTKELALEVSTAEGRKAVERSKPIDRDLGPPNACQYGRVMLAVDPFPRPDQVRKTMGSGWQVVPGVGDAAFYRQSSSVFVDLYVWDGAHHFTIQMSLGSSDTAESLKPNAIALARAVIARLR